MGSFLFILEFPFLVFQGLPSIVTGKPQFGSLEMFSNSLEILEDLMSKFTCMTSDNCLVRFILVGLSVCYQLIQNWDNKNCSFTHSRFSLTKNVLALQCVRNSIDLHLTWMLEAAFSDSSFEFIFQEKLVPSCKVSPELSFTNAFLIGLDLFLIFTMIGIVRNIHGL